MMKNILLLLALCTTLLTYGDVFAATSTSHDKWIRTSIQSLMKKNKIPGVAVLLYAHGKISTYYFGEADPIKHIRVSEDTLFEIGSITKTFTGILLAKYSIEQKMQLSDPIAHYAGFDRLTHITLQQLATHTSSLPYNAEKLAYNASISEKNTTELRRFLHTWTAPFPPGTKAAYSNFGFGMLGMILSRSAGNTLPTLMKQHLLDPLEMRSSGLDIPPHAQGNLALGFTEQGKPVRHLSSGLFSGSWAMKTSPKDMQNYLKAALGVAPVPDIILQAMKMSQMAYYVVPKSGNQLGLGWKITPLDSASTLHKLTHNPAHYSFATYDVHPLITPRFNPNTLIAKSGGTDGFRSYMAFIPNKQVGIVILTNRYFNSGDLSNLANTILFQITGMQYLD